MALDEGEDIFTHTDGISPYTPPKPSPDPSPSPNPSPSPSPNPSPLPDPTPDPNHHDQDDHDYHGGGRSGIPDHGTSWSREKSIAVAGATLAAAAAGGASYYGYNAGRGNDPSRADDPGDVEMTGDETGEFPAADPDAEPPGVESNFTNPVEPESNEEGWDGDPEPRFDPSDGNGYGGDPGTAEADEFDELLGKLGGDGNRTFTLGDEPADAGDIPMEELPSKPTVPETAPTEPEESWWEKLWDNVEEVADEAVEGIEGAAEAAGEMGADAAAIAGNIGEVAAGAATEAGAGEGLAAAVGAMGEGAEIGALFEMGL